MKMYSYEIFDTIGEEWCAKTVIVGMFLDGTLSKESEVR